jgi:S1-C subfamily serine protease
MFDYSPIIDQIRQSIAFIFAQGEDGVFGQGTGFVYWKKGILVTCNHVIKDAKSILIRFPDTPLQTFINAEVIITDPEHDLALLKFDDTKKKPLEQGNEKEVKEGIPVLIAGYPLNISSLTAHQGILSGITKDATGTTVFLIDGTVNSGNSGGPLMNQKGEVIGVVNAKRREQSDLLEKVEILKLGALSLHGIDLVELHQALIRNLQLGIGYAVPCNYIPSKK